MNWTPLKRREGWYVIRSINIDKVIDLVVKELINSNNSNKSNEKTNTKTREVC